MGKPALRRRRGTRANSSLFGEHKILQAILGGMLLIAIGLAFGIGIGLMTYGTGDASKTEGVAGNFLRKAKNAEVKIQERMHRNIQETPKLPKLSSPVIPAAHANAPDLGAKANFLNHIPDIGSLGDFPYYPQNKELVSKNHDFSSFQAKGGYRFEEYKHGDSPYSYEKGESDELARSRRYHVKKAMEHAWNGYEQYAFGKDEILPRSKGSSNNWGGLATTMVDSLDTLWLMGMKDEFYRARDWISKNLDHNKNYQVSVFETTIRSLGGLLSAYDWSGDAVFLTHAKDLGERLFKAVEANPDGLPMGQVNLATGAAHNIAWTGNSAILAEFGTIQMEFRMLARLSGKADYKTKIEGVFDKLRAMKPKDGLYPYFIRVQGSSLSFANDKLTFGAMADSFYEYMLKLWIQGGKTEQKYRDMYDESMQGMFDQLLQLSTPSELVFIADRNNGNLDTKMDHLACFMGGLLALGAYTDPLGVDSERAQRDLKTAKALTYTCYQAYARMPTGIAPEFLQFYPNRDFESGRGAPHYLLRPETVESFFILYQVTGDPVYREWGWEVFQAIERYCKAEAGYGSLKDVRNTQGVPDNKMESFFLAETLKYLYLLFDPDTEVDVLHKHVFNTEAHPVRIFPQMDADGVPSLL